MTTAIPQPARRSALVTGRPKLVILRALGLGDLLTAVPAIRALAAAFPHHHRILAAPLYLAPLAQMCGGIEEVVDAAPLGALDESLRGADVAVNLHGRGPQSHRVLLALRPEKLIAFANAQVEGTDAMPEWRPDEHEVHRWSRMLTESGIPADPGNLDLRAPVRDERARGAIVIHPSAATGSRRWPADRWIELCATLLRDGQSVVMTGSAGEFRRCRQIAKSAHVPINAVLAGRTDVGDLACILAAARAIVCGDTGVAHLATGLGTPSVVLFGPTSPQFWGPSKDRLLHRVIWRGTTGDPHANVVDPGLASITVGDVLAELEGLLHLPRAG